MRCARYPRVREDAHAFVPLSADLQPQPRLAAEFCLLEPSNQPSHFVRGDAFALMAAEAPSLGRYLIGLVVMVTGVVSAASRRDHGWQRYYSWRFVGVASFSAGCRGPSLTTTRCCRISACVRACVMRSASHRANPSMHPFAHPPMPQLLPLTWGMLKFRRLPFRQIGSGRSFST